ncbi:MAG: YkgJ family cysteine cluster protein [Desulfotalea sp.]
MSNKPALPGIVKQIKDDEKFCFSCHKGVSCFTECCRMLELMITPYDILRLKKATGLTSRQVLDQFVIEEFEETDIFPRYYLTMVDDGRASCVFVGEEGCKVYENRPSACRTYPLGRAAVYTRSGETKEHFLLIQEDHCLGFNEANEQTTISYNEDQGLPSYNKYNDLVASLTHGEKIQHGFRPDANQTAMYSLALYDTDNFRKKILSEELNSHNLANLEIINTYDDEAFLNFAIEWIKAEFFQGK